MLPFPTASADLSRRAKLRLKGPDRLRYLNGQVTNDVAQLKNPGDSQPACVTNAKGKLDADVVITELSAEDDAFLIDADPALRQSLLARLEKFIIADDVELTDVTDEFTLYHIVPLDPLHDSYYPEDVVSAHSILFSHINRFGPPGLDILAPVTGADSPPPNLPEPISPELLEIIRIAHCIPRWGAELTPDTLPPEAGLDKYAVSYTKGCYVGQEVLSRIKSVGRVNKQLVTLVALKKELPLEPGLTLYTKNSDKIGVITSSINHSNLFAPLALGYVKTASASPDTPVFAGTDAEPLAFSLVIKKTPLIWEEITS